jgi:hypothetical protein
MGTQPENTHGFQTQIQPNPYPNFGSGSGITLGYPILAHRTWVRRGRNQKEELYMGENVPPYMYTIWQYRLLSFQTRGTKLERFLPKNQHTQRKLLNFENWNSGGLRIFQKSEFLKVNYFHLLRRKNTSN